PIDLGSAAFRTLEDVRLETLALGHTWFTQSPFGLDLDERTRAIEVEPAAAYRGDTTAALADIQAWVAADMRVVFVAPGHGQAQRTVEWLTDAGVAAAFDDEVTAPSARVVQVSCAELDHGFVSKPMGLAVLTYDDLVGQRTADRTERKMPARRRKQVDPLELKTGDFVVHEQHGVGRYIELMQRVVQGAAREYLVVEYAPSKRGQPADRLFVPMDQLDQISRYVGGESPSLDKLGGADWTSRKNKARKAVRQIAGELIKLYAARQATKGHAFGPDTPWQAELEDAFAFVETPDQMVTIDEVKRDMERTVPMDRLVCGDVGYGKTEVALRAAAAVAFSGRQVAVLAPTTLLARQHLRTFRRRFAGLGIEVGELSRVVDAATARRTRKALKDGTIRVVVGTQAICAASVGFHDLGLVIVDEEQKFGARHKAQVRSMAETAHALTMTATPIPRTLQASLVGLQDLSVIATPPYLRQPVRTSVATPDATLVREALMREKRRGGQSFFVCPRVADIEPAREFLHRAVPELTMRVAHGQMKPADMDAEMLAFAEGDGDVLLATSIIESGLDVPGANTLFVWDAGRFGMSQLHQLRGRVGRGARRAFVTFLTQEGDSWKKAEKRLRTLESLDHLGAGFAISARDLDLRGAGDLLGDEQAGHMKLIGVGLYQELLAHAMARARGEAVSDSLPPELNLGLDARIPAEYVPEPEMRLGLYAAIDALRTLAAFEAFELSLVDRFGPPPSSVLAFLAAARLRLSARELGIRRLDAGRQGMAATFAPGRLKPFETGTSGWTVTDEKIASPNGRQDPDERLMLAENFLEDIRAIFEASGREPRRPALTASSR
ncbi:MAG: mfd, partial [Hyphomicrobiales bacterium]|nr:mfd [Hyphomicrobiales bacterium]